VKSQKFSSLAHEQKTDPPPPPPPPLPIFFSPKVAGVPLAVSEEELRDFCFARDRNGGGGGGVEPLSDLLGEGASDPRFLVTFCMPEFVVECSDRLGATGPLVTSSASQFSQGCVCMYYVCMYICICMYIHMHMCANISIRNRLTHTHKLSLSHTHTYKHKRPWSRVVGLNFYGGACVCICIYICMNIHLYVYVYEYTYTQQTHTYTQCLSFSLSHTHTHTHTRP